MRLALGSFVGFFILAMFAACSDDTPSSSSSGVFATSGGGTSGGGSSSGGSAAGVACTHPGAGNPIAGQDGRCECVTTRKVAGEWSAKRTCREGDTCPLNVGDETFTVTQTGTSIKLDTPNGKSLTGDLCGDVIVFNGTTSGDRECGHVRLTDDTHWVSDSCYVAGSGGCNLSFGSGCPSQKGQCTGTATKGGAANPIVKDLCKTK